MGQAVGFNQSGDHAGEVGEDAEVKAVGGVSSKVPGGDSAGGYKETKQVDFGPAAHAEFETKTEHDYGLNCGGQRKPDGNGVVLGKKRQGSQSGCSENDQSGGAVGFGLTVQDSPDIDHGGKENDESA